MSSSGDPPPATSSPPGPKFSEVLRAAQAPRDNGRRGSSGLLSTAEAAVGSALQVVARAHFPPDVIRQVTRIVHLHALTEPQLTDHARAWMAATTVPRPFDAFPGFLRHRLEGHAQPTSVDGYEEPPEASEETP